MLHLSEQICFVGSAQELRRGLRQIFSNLCSLVPAKCVARRAGGTADLQSRSGSFSESGRVSVSPLGFGPLTVLLRTVTFTLVACHYHCLLVRLDKSASGLSGSRLLCEATLMLLLLSISIGLIYMVISRLLPEVTSKYIQLCIGSACSKFRTSRQFVMTQKL